MELQKIISQLQLEPLEQEGGLYRQTWCSAYGTAIFYLLKEEDYSHFHKLLYDEVYHFYLGDPVCLWELSEDGQSRMAILGQNLDRGEQVQHIVPAHTWQGSCRLAAYPGMETGGTKGYSLLGTTMAPGYSQDCYEHGDREMLLKQYPDAAAAIRRLSGE